MKYLILLLLFVVDINAVNVTIYTTNSKPFSFDKKGYSIDYVNTILQDTFGTTNLATSIIILPSIPNIFPTVVGHLNDANHFAVGVSSITITKAREIVGDFLPSYFSSGAQVMISINISNISIIKQVLINFFIVSGIAIGILCIIASIMSPIVWITEIKYCPDDMWPIFMDHKLRQKPEPLIVGGYKILNSKLNLILNENINALVWVGSTIGGIQTGYPNSWFGRLMHSLFKGFSALFVLLMFAGLSVILNVNSASDNVKGFNDLSGRTVCTVAGETTHQMLIDRNYGFTIVTVPNIPTMFKKFENGECNTIVYDYPALRQEVSKYDAKIVGPIFNFENYGIFINENNVYKEILRRAVIAQNLDQTSNEALKEKWFASSGANSNQQNPGVPVALYVVPSVLGIGFFTILVLMVYGTYDDNTKKYNENYAQSYDTNYNNDLRETIIEQQSSEVIYRGNDYILDKMYPLVLMIKRLLIELHLIGDGRNINDIAGDLLPARRTNTQAMNHNVNVEMGHI